MRISRAIFALCAALLCCVHSANAGFAKSIDTDKDSGVTITVRSPLETLPAAGIYPVEVEILNVSGAERSWRINSSVKRAVYTSGEEYVFESGELTVPNGDKKSFSLLLPLGPPPSKVVSYNPNLNGAVSGYGVTRGNFYVSANQPEWSGTGGKRLELTPYTALNDTAIIISGSIKDAYKYNDLTFNGSQTTDFSKFPPDWRALTGVEAAFITADEWRALPAPNREAIKDWIMQGGHLFAVISSDSDQTFVKDLGVTVNSPRAQYTFGHVTLLLYPEYKIDAGLIANEPAALVRAHPVLSSDFSEYRNSNYWKLSESVKQLVRSSPIIILIVLCYAVLVGPINLYVFVSKDNRGMLYLTTPVISMAASIILIAIMLLQDGTGGSGRRLIGVMLHSNENKALVYQEQISLTGLILSTSFKAPQDSVMLQLPVPDLLKSSKSNNSTYYDYGANGTFVTSDKEYWGDWWGSRKLNGQLLTSIKPTRARVEILNGEALRSGAAPIILSSLKGTLTNILVTDQSGRVWTGEKVRPGVQSTLSAAPITAGRPDFMSRVKTLAGPVLTQVIRNGLEGLRNEPGTFIGELKGNSEFTTDTFDAISWEEDRVLVFGPVSVTFVKEAK